MKGLTAPKDKDIRSQILTIMEQDPEITGEKVPDKHTSIKEKYFAFSKDKTAKIPQK